MSEPLIRDVSDTARWMAVYRARETERPDAVFRDPFARALAGDRGERIAAALPFADDNAWSFVARTYLFDRIVARQVHEGCDLVLNLAAGLDTRPYRLELPPSLRWVEVDLPEILDYKEQVLGDATPRCALERVRLDLSNPDARRGLFNRHRPHGDTRARPLRRAAHLLDAPRSRRARAGSRRAARDPALGGGHRVTRLARDDARAHGQGRRRSGRAVSLRAAGRARFFAPYGWSPVKVRSLMKAAAKLERLPLALRMLSLLQDSNGPQGNRPWSAVCLLAKSSANS